MKTFLESHFEVMLVYQFQTKPNIYEDICWVSIWSFVSLWVSKKSGLWSRHLLSFILKWCKFMSFKQNRILLKTFVLSQFGVMQVYEFQRKANSYEDTFQVSVWSYGSLSVSNKREVFRKHLLSLSSKLSKFTSFKQKGILMKTFLESQFESI